MPFPTNKSISRYLGSSITHNKMAYCLAFVTSLAGAATNIMGPLFLSNMIGTLENEPKNDALPWLLAYAAAWIAAKAIPVIRDEALVPAGTKLSHELTRDVMQAFYDSPMEQRVSSASAETVHHFGMAYEHIGRSFVDGVFGKMMPAIIDLTTALTITSINSSYFGLITGGAIIAHFTLLALGASKVAGAQNNYIQSLFEGYEYIIEQLGQYANVHYFGAVKRELAHLTAAMAKLDKSLNKSILIRNRATFLQSNLLTALSLLGGGLFYILAPGSDNLSLDNFLWLLLYLSQIAPSFEKLGESTNKILADYGTFKQLVEYLNVTASLVNTPQPPLRLDSSTAHISFEGVSFRYQGGNVGVEKISFFVPAGKTIVITGPSGAGKSSILNLLQKFYLLSEGKITIAGQDIAKVNVASLRATFAVVPQLPVLQNTSLYENIRYAKPDASLNAIRTAAIRAGLGKFIETHGLNFEIGENGSKLSGGQRQRLAIARAYLRQDSPILVLDEPTSALDPLTEKLVFEELDKLILSRTSTTLIIIHRLTTIKYLSNVDSIIVLDKGQIVEQGTLKQLMDKDGLFASQMRIAQEEEILHAKQGLTQDREPSEQALISPGIHHVQIPVTHEHEEDAELSRPLLGRRSFCCIQ